MKYTDPPVTVVEVAFDGVNYQDISSRVRRIEVRRGRERERDRMGVGTATLVLDNRDGALDPDNTSSPYYPDVKPGRPVRIRAKVGSGLKPLRLGRGALGNTALAAYETETVSLFVGRTEGGSISGPRPRPEREVTWEATDEGKRLNLDRNATGYGSANELTGSRINRILDAASPAWPSSLRDIDPGRRTVQPQSGSGGRFDGLQEVAESEGGALFIGRDGKVVFRDANHAPTVAATFSTSGPYKYLDLEIADDDRDLYNAVKVTASGIADQSADDTGSQAEFGRRDYSLQTVLSNAVDASELATAIRDVYAWPRRRIVGMTVAPPHGVPPKVALAREMTDRLRVVYATSYDLEPPVTSGLVAWYKADAITGVPDGGAVGTWPDSSGRGKDATQATASRRPTYVASGLNGRPVVRFDGTDDFLTTPDLGAGAQPNTIVAVLRCAATGSQMNILQGATGGSTSAIYVTSTGKWAIWAGVALASTTSADTSAHVVSGIFDATEKLYLDGSMIVSGNAGSEGLATLRMGASDAGGSFFNGDIAEVLVYDRALTDAERQQVEAYLRSRWFVVLDQILAIQGIDISVVPTEAWRVRYALAFPLGTGGVKNLLTANQSSIETDASGWVAEQNCTLARTTAESYVGSAALAVTTTGALLTEALCKTTPYTTVPVTAGKTYEAAAWFRAPDAGMPAKVIISWRNSSDVEVGTAASASTNVYPEDGWKRVAVQGAAPTGAAYAVVRLRVVEPYSNSNRHYADAISLRQVS